MIIAYKGFDKDLSCTSGGNKFQYKVGEWNEEPEANCARNGFHCAENPLDCLTYYPNWENSVYYVVLAEGDINEDGIDSKISCTRIKLIKQLTLEEFLAEAMFYMCSHPHASCGTYVKKDECVAIERSKFVIVRGKEPVAKGRIGTILCFAKESPTSKEIIDVGMHVIDGIKIPENKWISPLGVKAEMVV